MCLASISILLKVLTFVLISALHKWLLLPNVIIQFKTLTENPSIHPELFSVLSYRLVLYCDICIVFLKYFFTYGALNLTFTLHSVTCWLFLQNCTWYCTTFSMSLHVFVNEIWRHSSQATAIIEVQRRGKSIISCIPVFDIVLMIHVHDCSIIHRVRKKVPLYFFCHNFAKS